MKINTISLPLIAILFFCSCGKRSKEKGDKIPDITIEQKNNIVKMKQIVFAGNRYVVEADFGLAKKVPLMVHGNTSMYLMLTHDIAEKLNYGKPIEKTRDYGYSEKGSGRINVKKFQIGGKTFHNIMDVSVFDWPEDVGKAAQGMIGVTFFKNEKVKIDFLNEQMEIGVSYTGKPDKSLLDKGYIATKIFIENDEAYINVFFEALNKEIPITIGTVADELSLDYVTFKDAIKIKKVDGKVHSPDDTSPEIYANVTPIKYKISNQSFKIPHQKSSIYSFAQYEDISQLELPAYGIFGRDWMKENNAIIDYANQILYFK
jgi:hypothetical protein